MSYHVRIRHGGGLIVAEYRCPEHGLFEVTAQRVDDGAPTEHACECGTVSPWTPSAPKMRVDTVLPTAAVRGGDTERRPGMLDTRPLAEGMPMAEWRKVQDKHREERRHQQMVANGLKPKRVQIGGGEK